MCNCEAAFEKCAVSVNLLACRPQGCIVVCLCHYMEYKLIIIIAKHGHRPVNSQSSNRWSLI